MAFVAVTAKMEEHLPGENLQDGKKGIGMNRRPWRLDVLLVAVLVLVLGAGAALG